MPKNDIRLKVEYMGPIKPILDNRIQQAMASIGAVCTGAGTDLRTGIRDLGFKIDGSRMFKVIDKKNKAGK